MREPRRQFGAFLVPGQMLAIELRQKIELIAASGWQSSRWRLQVEHRLVA